MQFEPPAKLLHAKGDPPIPWTRWKEEFLTYMKAIDGDRMGNERKKNILLHCLGSEGQAVFRNLPAVQEDLSSFEDVLAHMECRFKPTTSIALNRYTFYTRTQRETESFDDFLTALRALAISCNFGVICDEMIRNQIIVNVRSKRTQEQLWVLGNPNLHDTIATAKAFEQSARWMKTVEEVGAKNEKNCR